MAKPSDARRQHKAAQKDLEQRLRKHPCGDCVACCQVHAFKGAPKPDGALCQHARVASLPGIPGYRTPEYSGGCSIYARRPQACKDYFCAWRFGLLGEDAALRPDALNVVFDIVEDAPGGVMVLEARETRAGAIDEAMPTFMKLAQRGIVCRLLEPGRSRLVGAEERVKAVQQWDKRHLPLVAR